MSNANQTKAVRTLTADDITELWFNFPVPAEFSSQFKEACSRAHGGDIACHDWLNEWAMQPAVQFYLYGSDN